MLRWAMIFAIIALVAAVLGFGGIAATAAGFAKILFYIFVVLFLVALVAGLAAGRRVAPWSGVDLSRFKSSSSRSLSKDLHENHQVKRAAPVRAARLLRVRQKTQLLLGLVP